MSFTPQPLDLGGQSIAPQQNEAGSFYYVLNEHVTKEHGLVTAFTEAGKFTFKVRQPISKETLSGHQYLRWSKPFSITTTVKRNAKGLASVNIFRTSASRLMNESTNPRVLHLLRDYGVDAAYIQLLHQQLEAAGARLTPAQEQSLSFTVERGFIGHSALEGGQEAYCAALIYIYPAFAEFSARWDAAARPKDKKRRPPFPDAFTPYLREPSWDRMIQKLFGKRLPAQVLAGLQPEVVTMPQLAGAFLVRSLVPAERLLDYPILPASSKEDGNLTHYAIPEVRKVLRACDESSRERLLSQLQASSTQGYLKFVRTLRVYLESAYRSKREMKVKPVTDVASWEHLIEVIKPQYEPQLSNNRYAKEARRKRPLALLKSSFSNLNETHGASFQFDRLQAKDLYGEARVLIDVDGERVGFADPLMANPGALPRGNPLREVLSEIKRRGLKYNTSPNRNYRTLRFSFEDGTLIIEQLVRSLDRLLLRHGIERTPRNRTRALVVLVMFFNSREARSNNIERAGAHCWSLIGSTLPLVNVYEGIILGASSDEMKELMQVASSTRQALTGYNPASPKHNF